MKSKSRGTYDAILIDLDGTLLDLDINRFIPAYIALLAGRFKERFDKDVFAGHLFQSTGKMVANNDPGQKNETVFYEDFCARLGMTYPEIALLVEKFYEEDFPALKDYGRSHPYSDKVVKAAFKKDLPLILATNPIFPRAAVEQRLKWGGLDCSAFKLITAMDNMHFCKPNPAYYLEIADLIGCAPERCLMAGNDTLEDMIAAETGMDTFLVEDFLLSRPGQERPADHKGSLKDLALFIENRA